MAHIKPLELKVLNKAFSQYYVDKGRLLKRQAYSYRFFCAAWAYSEQKKTIKALKAILISFFYFPLAAFRKSHITLLIRIVAREQPYKKLQNLVSRSKSERFFSNRRSVVKQ